MKRALAGRVAILTLMVALSTGCVEKSPDCGAVGGTEFVAVSVEPSVRARLTSFRLKLCQSGRCEAADFSTKKTTVKDGPYRGRYVIRLSDLGRDWDPEAEAKLDFRGRSATGKTVEPYLRYTMRVGRSDLVRRSG